MALVHASRGWAPHGQSAGPSPWRCTPPLLASASLHIQLQGQAVQAEPVQRLQHLQVHLQHRQRSLKAASQMTFSSGQLRASLFSAPSAASAALALEVRAAGHGTM